MGSWTGNFLKRLGVANYWLAMAYQLQVLVRNRLNSKFRDAERDERRQNLEGNMTSKIGIRVKLKNMQTMREQLGVTGTNHLLQRIETFLQKRLRGTDGLEQAPLGEFHLSILNADSGCIPALQRRFSPSVLQRHFSNAGGCVPDFCVETETQGIPSTAGSGGFEEALCPGPGQATFRR